MDHAIATTFIKIKVTKVDLTAVEQRIWPYQHVWQSVRLPPIFLGKLIELTFAHKALNPL